MSYQEYYRQDITNFERYGTYQYKYDQVGNVVFDSSSGDFSQIFLAFPIPNFSYDNSKILSFYDATFVEFIPQKESGSVSINDVQKLQEDLQNQKNKNEELTQQLDTLISVNESDPSQADILASKQVILELRKSLGQGRVDSDFSEDFPYAPIKKTNSLVSDTTGVNQL